MPAYSIPWARSFLRSSAPGSRGTRSRIVHRVLLGAAAAAQVRDQLSLAPPPRAAPRQSPPPDAPRSPRRARAPPARVRAPHLAPWTPMPAARWAAIPTPSRHPDGKVPAPAVLSSTDAMAAHGIPPQGTGGSPQKRALGACPSRTWGSAVLQRAGAQPQPLPPPSCSQQRPGAATLAESRKAHRLCEPAPSVGFKRPLSAPGVAERFLWFLVLLATSGLPSQAPLILETRSPRSETP